jgi:16S rRNA processing protein RimM
MQLSALLEDGSRRALKIEELWPHKGMLVLKFAAIDSISDAETLIRSELQVPREERAELEAGWNYVSDLIGCTVFDGEREIGIVRHLTFGAGEAPLLIVQAGTKQHEIPYAEAYVKKLDLEGKQIWMQLPEGLLELDAPLTQEEKEQQKRQ